MNTINISGLTRTTDEMDFVSSGVTVFSGILKGDNIAESCFSKNRGKEQEVRDPTNTSGCGIEFNNMEHVSGGCESM